MLMAKIESKIVSFASKPYSSWVVFDLARNETLRPKVVAALKGHGKELEADASNRAAHLLSKLTKNPKDLSVFEKPTPEDAKQREEKPAEKASTPSKSPGKDAARSKSKASK